MLILLTHLYSNFFALIPHLAFFKIPINRPFADKISGLPNPDPSSSATFELDETETTVAIRTAQDSAAEGARIFAFEITSPRPDHVALDIAATPPDFKREGGHTTGPPPSVTTTTNSRHQWQLCAGEERCQDPVHGQGQDSSPGNDGSGQEDGRAGDVGTAVRPVAMRRPFSLENRFSTL